MNKDEKILWIAVRSILLLVAFMFVAYVTFWKPECDSDAVFLACRLTGTWADWVGSIMFFSGLVILSGVLKVLHVYDSENSVKWNVLTFIMSVLGVVLFWNL